MERSAHAVPGPGARTDHTGPLKARLLSGRGWFRTSDLSRVKRSACRRAIGRKPFYSGQRARDGRAASHSDLVPDHREYRTIRAN
jgi:hypothetical protein